MENRVSEEKFMEEQAKLIDEAQTIVSGFSSSSPTFLEELLTQEMIDEAVALLDGYDGEFEEKTKLLNDLE